MNFFQMRIKFVDLFNKKYILFLDSLQCLLNFHFSNFHKL